MGRNSNNTSTQAIADDSNDAPSFRIQVLQDDEMVTLSFLTEERRDHELGRLLSVGVVCRRD